MKKILNQRTIRFLLAMLAAVFAMAVAAACGDHNRTLTFMADGRQVAVITAEAGAEIAAPADPVKDGYAFVGWYRSGDGIPTVDDVEELPSVMPDEDRTYYAYFEEVKADVSYTIKLYKQNMEKTDYVLDENDVRTGKGKAGEVVSPKPLVSGFDIDYTHAGTVATLTLSEEGENVFVFYCNRGTYTLSFDKNAEDAAGNMDSAAYLYGTEITVAESAFTRTGYRFGGWAVKADGTADARYLPKSEILLGENLTLYAVWQKGYVNADTESGDMVYVSDKAAGLGAVVLVKGGEEKTGFLNRTSMEFTFYYDEGDIYGKIDEANGVFRYRDPSYGYYAGYNYATGKYYTAVLYADGYGQAAYGQMVGGGFQMQYYGAYSLTEHGDYAFEILDVSTGKPTGEGFYFLLRETSDVGENMDGAFLMQGEESGSFFCYDNGEILSYRLDLNGYGDAVLLSHDAEADRTELVAEGTYKGTANYTGVFGEWEFLSETSDFEDFKFVLNRITGSGSDVTVYIEYDAAREGDYRSSENGAKLYLDGYGGAEYTAADGTEMSGLYVASETLVTFTVYGEDDAPVSTVYFVMNWAARTFTQNDTGFVVDGTVLVRYAGTSGIIEIPDTVTEIADGVFNYLYLETTVYSVFLPASITKIGARAFENAYTLRTVTVAATTPATLGDKAFDWPGGGFRIIVPDGCEDAYRAAAGWSVYAQYITSAAEIANVPEFETEGGVLVRYNRKSDAVNIKIPDGITQIADKVFMGADYLKSVDFNQVEVIGAQAFAYCSGLESVTLTNVREIGNEAFLRCLALTEIELPAVETIGESAFSVCENLVSVALGANAAQIGASAFYECAYYEEEANAKTLILSLAGTTPPSMGGGVFDGVSKYRIKIPDSETAKKCYADPSWSAYNTRLFMTPGAEAGTYYDKVSLQTLVLDGRAVLFGLEIMLYETEGEKIVFYAYDRSTMNFTVTEGSIQGGTVTLEYDGVERVFVKEGTALEYSDGENTLLLTAGGTTGDSMSYRIPAKYNGNDVQLNVGTNAVTFDFVGYVYTVYLEKDGSFTATRKFKPVTRTFTAGDGSTLTLVMNETSAYGSGRLRNVDGNEIIGSAYAWLCAKQSENVYTATVSFKNTRYLVTFTLSGDTFTYEYAPGIEVKRLTAASGNSVLVYLDGDKNVTDLRIMFRDTAGVSEEVESTYEKRTDGSYLFTVDVQTERFDEESGTVVYEPSPYNGTYLVTLDIEGGSCTIVMQSAG